MNHFYIVLILSLAYETYAMKRPYEDNSQDHTRQKSKYSAIEQSIARFLERNSQIAPLDRSFITEHETQAIQKAIEKNDYTILCTHSHWYIVILEACLTNGNSRFLKMALELFESKIKNDSDLLGYLIELAVQHKRYDRIELLLDTDSQEKKEHLQAHALAQAIMQENENMIRLFLDGRMQAYINVSSKNQTIAQPQKYIHCDALLFAIKINKLKSIKFLNACKYKVDQSLLAHELCNAIKNDPITAQFLIQNYEFNQDEIYQALISAIEIGHSYLVEKLVILQKNYNDYKLEETIAFALLKKQEDIVKFLIYRTYNSTLNYLNLYQLALDLNSDELAFHFYQHAATNLALLPNNDTLLSQEYEYKLDLIHLLLKDKFRLAKKLLMNSGNINPNLRINGDPSFVYCLKQDRLDIIHFLLKEEISLHSIDEYIQTLPSAQQHEINQKISELKHELYVETKREFLAQVVNYLNAIKSCKKLVTILKLEQELERERFIKRIHLFHPMNVNFDELQCGVKNCNIKHMAFYIACEYGNVEYVKYFMQNNGVRSCNYFSIPYISYNVPFDLDRYKALLEVHIDNPTFRLHSCPVMSPLKVASLCKHQEILKLLVAKAKNLGYELSLASQNKDFPEYFDAILEKTRNKQLYLNAALTLACQLNNQDVVKVLLKKGANPEGNSSLDKSKYIDSDALLSYSHGFKAPLNVAIEANNSELVNILHEHKAMAKAEQLL